MNKQEKIIKIDKMRRHYGIRCANCRYYDGDKHIPFCLINRKLMNLDDYCSRFDWKKDK